MGLKINYYEGPIMSKETSVGRSASGSMLGT